MCGGQRITLELGLSPSTFIPGLEFSSPGLHGKSLYPRSEPSKQPLLLLLNEQIFTLGGKNVPKPLCLFKIFVNILKYVQTNNVF